MTNYSKAIVAFFRTVAVGAGTLKVYQANQVQKTTTFPYLTIEITDGDTFQRTWPVARLWCQIGSGGRDVAEAQRAAILDNIRIKIPYQGYLLRFTGGFAMIFRGNPFIQFYNDPDDTTILGARIALEVTHYEE